MAKITRTIIINGTKHWVRARTEQEFDEQIS